MKGTVTNEVKNPRIAFFMNSLGGGGAEKCMLALAKGMAKDGFDIALVLASAEGSLVDKVEPPVGLVDLRCSSIWRSVPKLARYMEASRPDVVISALEHANIAALAGRLLAGVRLRIVVTTHTMLSLETRMSTLLTVRALPWALRILYPSADSIVAVSEAVATDLSQAARVSRERVQVVHNPVDIEEIYSESQTPPADDWAPDAKLETIIAVGNLWPHKDHRTLIRALSEVNRTRPVGLVILGEGPERPVIESLIHMLRLDDRVRMPGFDPNPYKYIARSAALVLPSQWEGLPTVLIEAMACGVTPVATDCPGGSREVLADGIYGYLTPVGNPSAMAETIIKALDRPKNSEALRARASEFSVSRAVDQYSQIVHRLVSPR